MKRFSLAFLSAVGILMPIASSAATITNFTAGYVSNQSTFSVTPLTASYSGNSAVVTNTTISCIQAATCSGRIINFAISGTGLDPSQQSIFSIDGNLSGTAGGSGVLQLATTGGMPVANQAFTFSAGDFNTTILKGNLPVSGSFDLSGALSLTLTPGQTLTLPSSFAIAVGNSPSSVPEPGSMALFSIATGGLVFAARRLKRASFRSRK